jgi:hypothetical protein
VIYGDQIPGGSNARLGVLGAEGRNDLDLGTLNGNIATITTVDINPRIPENEIMRQTLNRQQQLRIRAPLDLSRLEESLRAVKLRQDNASDPPVPPSWADNRKTQLPSASVDVIVSETILT